MESIDATEWSNERRLKWAKKLLGNDGGTDEIARLKMDAIDGNLSNEPRTITTRFDGDTKEEALGRGYKVRDTILEHTDLDATCELGDKMWEFDKIPDYYQVKIHIEGGDE